MLLSKLTQILDKSLSSTSNQLRMKRYWILLLFNLKIVFRTSCITARVSNKANSIQNKIDKRTVAGKWINWTNEHIRLCYIAKFIYLQIRAQNASEITVKWRYFELPYLIYLLNWWQKCISTRDDNSFKTLSWGCRISSAYSASISRASDWQLKISKSQEETYFLVCETKLVKKSEIEHWMCMC